MMLATLTIAGAALLAFANGANDVSKGVATLAGSGRASYRTAIAWGTFWTFAGAMASLVITVGLIETFTSDVVVQEVLSISSFPLAVALGAAAWVIVASLTGLPVSTTHALTGAIVGVALMVGSTDAVQWWVLMSSIAAPLALSPLVSAVVGYGMHAVAERVSPACVCVEESLNIQAVRSDGTTAAMLVPDIVTSANGCSAAVAGWRIIPAGVLHWGAAAALSFARGVNDNAKIAAIAAISFPASAGHLWVAFAVTGAAMTLGSYTAGLRVTQTLGERVVHMHQDTGLAASLVASALVLAASVYTLPVSTTHVSTGAIIGAGMRQGNGAVEWRRVGSLVIAWVGTLPIAAALAATAAWLVASVS